MSIITLDPGESLTAVLAGAVSATNPTYMVRYRDADQPAGEATQPAGSLDGTTAVTLVADPSTHTRRRHIESIQVYNGDTASVTLTLTMAAPTSVTLTKLTIRADDTFRWDANGIDVTSLGGRRYRFSDTIGGV